MGRRIIALALTVTATLVVPVRGEAVVAPGGRLCVRVPDGAGALAVVNLTPLNAMAPGYGTLMPFGDSGAPPPVASNVNFAPGTVDPNVAAAIVDPTDMVCFVNSAHGQVDLAADLLFSVAAGGYAVPDGGPARLADTRVGLSGQRLAPGERRCMSAYGDPGDLAAVNLTPVGANAPGFGTLVSSDVTASATSNVNFATGTIDPNLALAPIGADGRVCFLNSAHADVDLVADHLFTILRGGFAEPATPTRLLDTRSTPARPVAPGERRCFTASGVPGDLAIVNLTPVGANAAGHGALLTSDAKAGYASVSNVNFAPGTADPNLGAAKIGADGTVCFVNSDHAAVDVIADQLATLGTWTPIASGAVERMIDTRYTGEDLQTCPAPDRCYALAGSWLVRSTDGGHTWLHAERVDQPVGYVGLSPFLHCTTATTCVYSDWSSVRTQGRSMATFDGGITWRSGPVGPTDAACPTDRACLVTHAFVNPAHFGRDLSVSVTLDGGDAWRHHDVPDDAIPNDVAYQGLTCPAPTHCTIQNVTFSSDDGWATVTVTVAS